MTFTISSLHGSRLEALDRDQLLSTVRVLLAEANALSSRIAAVNEIGLAINQSLDLDEILEIVAKKAKWLLDFDHCSVCLEDGENGYKVVTLFGEAHRGCEASLLLDTPNVGFVLKSKQSLIVREGSASPFLTSFESQLIIPLAMESRVIGTINFAATKPHAYTQDDLRIGYMFALQLAGALRNVTHIQELQQAHAELHRYAAQLEERNQELDAYNHTIAHDLKSPLSAITLKTYLLRRKFEATSPEALRYTAEIDTEAHRMSTMIDQLLWLSRLRDATGNLTVVDSDRVADGASARFLYALESQHIRLTIAPDLPPVMGHSQWIEEVFANLLSNAIKYMPIGKPDAAITIRGVRQDNVVRFEVQDTGIGIAPDDQAHLFEMFTRVNPGHAEGLGLGLSIVHRIVTKLQGQVGVESTPGEGSTFWFTLPAAPPVPESAPQSAPQLAPEPTAKPTATLTAKPTAKPTADSAKKS